MPKSRHYVAPAGATVTGLAKRFAALERVSAGQLQATHRCLLDSADRRLAQAGLYLLCDVFADFCRLSLHDAAGRPAAPTLNLPRLPTAACECPAPACDILDPRVPVIVRTCDATQLTLQCRNEDDKLLGEVEIVAHEIPGRDTPLISLTTSARRSYQRDLHSCLAGALGACEPLTVTVAALLDRRLPAAAAELPRREAPGVSANTPARVALAGLLSHYRALMQDNEDGIEAGLDIEHLHDFRVALRRARTLHAALADAARGDPLAREFAWLCRASGRLRDLDVWCSEFPDTGAPSDELAEALVRERQREHARFLRVLRGRRYAALQLGWAEWIERAAADTDSPALGGAVDRALQRRYNRLRRRAAGLRGRAIEYAALHALRKDAKKLRYLIDAFAALYPARQVAALLVPLKRLQSRAGKVCDRYARAQLLDDWLRGERSPRRRAVLAAASTALHLPATVEPDDRNGRRLAIALDAVEDISRTAKRLSETHRP